MSGSLEGVFLDVTVSELKELNVRRGVATNGIDVPRGVAFDRVVTTFLDRVSSLFVADRQNFIST